MHFMNNKKCMQHNLKLIDVKTYKIEITHFSLPEIKNLTKQKKCKYFYNTLKIQLYGNRIYNMIFPSKYEPIKSFEVFRLYLIRCIVELGMI